MNYESITFWTSTHMDKKIILMAYIWIHKSISAVFFSQVQDKSTEVQKMRETSIYQRKIHEDECWCVPTKHLRIRKSEQWSLLLGKTWSQLKQKHHVLDERWLTAE